MLVRQGKLTHSGTLSCLDGYMNIAMEETTEHVDGVLKSSYGDAFIRGNNGTRTLLMRSPVYYCTGRLSYP